MLVIDAGALVVALLDDRPVGAAVRAALAGEDLAAPALVDLEVLSVLRRFDRLGTVPSARIDRARRDLASIELERYRHAPLMDRCWALRSTVTSHDAAYVALAEALDAPMLTTDARLARAPGPTCRFRLVPLKLT